MHIRILSVIFSFGLMWVSIAQATIIPLDVPNFYTSAFPDEISVSASGSKATFYESEFMSPLRLINDPWAGDSEVIVAQDNLWLVFEYIFNEGSTDNDFVDIFLFDAVLGMLAGDISAFNFHLEASGLGTFTFDLSSLVGTTLGMSIEMSEQDFFPVHWAQLLK